MEKRKAAANVFMEQNIQEKLAEEEVYDQLPPEAQQSDDFYAVGSAAPKPPGMPLPAPQAERSRMAQVSPAKKSSSLLSGLKTSEELQLEKEPLRVRETGWWRWKRIIVPPNAYVVHTRMGKTKPITLGLGLSFRYNPLTDAYLIVPAAMQTIGIVANCISKEKQGINILAYVQWQIQDFAIAYHKLDFSDQHDPLGIVNAQLREQAEAAIKDKIATMSVEEVLTDKEPIIEELTTRLKAVAEGQGQLDNGTGGLGIKIVTVQIKEALVSSQRLWNDLQSPFRHEQERIARISHLSMEEQIRQRELETRQTAETSQAESLVEIERIKQSKQTEAQELRLREETTRFTREQESVRQRLELQEATTRLQRESEQRLQRQAAEIEQALRMEQLQREQTDALARTQLTADTNAQQKTLETEEALKILAEEERLAAMRLQTRLEEINRELTRVQADAQLQLAMQAQQGELEQRAQAAQIERQRQQTMLELELESARNRVHLALAEKEAAVARLQQEVRNSISSGDLASRLIERLPELAAEMPEIHDLRVLQTGGDGSFDALAGFLARITALAQHLGVALPAAGPTEPQA